MILSKIVVLCGVCVPMFTAAAPFFQSHSQECHNSVDCLKKLRDSYMADAENHLKELHFQLPPTELCNTSSDSSSVQIIATKIVHR